MTELAHMLADLADQVQRVTAERGPVYDMHHGLGLMAEEFKEYTDEIFMREAQRMPARIYKELVDICCVAVRTALSCGLVVLPPPPSYTDNDSGGQPEQSTH